MQTHTLGDIILLAIYAMVWMFQSDKSLPSSWYHSQEETDSEKGVGVEFWSSEGGWVDSYPEGQPPVGVPKAKPQQQDRGHLT